MLDVQAYGTLNDPYSPSYAMRKKSGIVVTL